MVQRAQRCLAWLMFSLCLVSISNSASSESLASALGGPIRPEWQFEEARQYDFWIGEWRANWRERLEDQISYENEGSWARHWCFTVLDGKALIEIVRGEEPNDSGAYTQGFSIRYYDPDKKRWVMAQNWPPPNTSYAFLDQLQGFAHHGRVQVFSGLVDNEGNEVVRRYTFSDISLKGFRWDDATTPDNGATWKSGTIAEFHRTGLLAKLPEVGSPLPDSPDGSHCTDPGFSRFGSLQGRWEGQAHIGSAPAVPARLVATRFQNGCSVLTLLEYPDGDSQFKLLEAITYGPKGQMWFVYRLDNRLGTAHQYRLGGEDETGQIVLNANPDLTIASDFSPPAWMGKVVPENPQERTVWTEIADESIAFESQKRSESGDWESVVSFRLQKQPH